MTSSVRVIAIDWSGAQDPSTQRKRIWIADANEVDIALHAGLTRDEVCAWLIAEVENSASPLIVGLDFAFSFPASFMLRRGFRNVEELWRTAADMGEDWLRLCDRPFWGRPRKKCPPTHGDEGFRQTDLAFEAVSGIRPKSPLQIGGAGAVGTGSIRGMPKLLQLRESGFSIWPFHVPAFPMAIEIYPRLLTGPVKKSNVDKRTAFLRRGEFQFLGNHLRRYAEQSEDAFDALISVIRMRQYAARFAKLAQATDPTELLEGRIWAPQERRLEA